MTNTYSFGRGLMTNDTATEYLLKPKWMFWTESSNSIIYRDESHPIQRCTRHCDWNHWWQFKPQHCTEYSCSGLVACRVVIASSSPYTLIALNPCLGVSSPIIPNDSRGQTTPSACRGHPLGRPERAALFNGILAGRPLSHRVAL
jgi:hypothetical protein